VSASVCARFVEQLEELAIGDLAEPERGILLAHAGTCHECRVRLDDLLALTDSLLSLAPQHEPPPGFETRVLDRLGVAPAAMAAQSRRRGGRRWAVLSAAALVLVVAAIGAVLVVRDDDDPTEIASGRIVSSGEIRNRDGERTGSVQLVDGEHPFALVTIDRPRQRGTEVRCELQLADGTTVDIGSWDYDDVERHMWAAGIDTSLLAATSMRVIAEDGTVVATAALD
jgi:hypothetical protein